MPPDTDHTSLFQQTLKQYITHAFIDYNHTKVTHRMIRFI